MTFWRWEGGGLRALNFVARGRSRGSGWVVEGGWMVRGVGMGERGGRKWRPAAPY